MSEYSYGVSGTTCGSCEVVIERVLKKCDGIECAEVSHSKRKIIIHADEQPDMAAINKQLKKHGYQLLDGSSVGAVIQAANWKQIGGVFLLLFSVYLLLKQMGVLTYGPSAAEPGSLVAVLVIGLIASVSSCTAVVGGLLAAVSGVMAKHQQNKSAKERMRPHWQFHAGRLAGFTVFGAAIGYLGSALQLSTAMNGLAVLVIAIIMILLGIQLMDLFPMQVVKMPKWLSHKVHELSESESAWAPFLLGAFTFFLPCGFTQSMQLLALSLQDPFQGAVIMVVFAFGTLPALLGIGALTSYVKGEKLKLITKVAGGLVFVLGFGNLTNGAALLGLNPATVFARADQAGGAHLVEGKQEIFMRMTSRGLYQPDILTVQKDIPVIWEIEGDDFMGCGDSLIMPAFGVSEMLKPGSNTVEFTPDRTGKFTFSCSMGMIRGTMIVTE